MPNALKDGDYTLAEGAAWIALDGLSIRLTRQLGGIGWDGRLLTVPSISVTVYRDGKEMEDPLAELNVPLPTP
jgi:hypothetical protein